MKEISKQFLSESIDYLRAFISPELIDRFNKNSFLPSKENPIIELYSNYSSLEIDDYNRIIDATKEFFDFLTNSNIYQTDKFFAFAIHHAKKVITRMVSRFSYENSGQKFANTVHNLSPTKPENAHILDVGPGIVPYSSLALATSTKKVSAMDDFFLFSNQSLQAMNVNAIEEYFDQNTNIDDYDFVVGSCPCTAIPYIVQKCKNQNKPYFLMLCDCATYSKKIPILNEFAELGKYTWSSILPEIDPKITIFDDYAFNLGSNPDLVKRIILNSNNAKKHNRLPTFYADKILFDSADIQIKASDLTQSTLSLEWFKQPNLGAVFNFLNLDRFSC